MFIPSEGAKNGEAGELIYYKNTEDVATSSNEQTTEFDGISIFPNPVQTQLTIKSNHLFVSQVKIYNMLGNLVFNSTDSFIGNKTFGVRGLTSGLYSLQIMNPLKKDKCGKSLLLQVL